MKYTIDDLEKDIAKRAKYLSAIRKDRGERYGTKDDTLANVATFGWRGAVINLFECAMRLRSAFLQSNPDLNDVVNASRDATNYSHYIELLIWREKGGCPDCDKKIEDEQV